MSESRAAHARVATLVSTLDGLVGAHLDTLAEMFLRGALVEPDELGETPRGKLLALAGTEPVHLALRPFVKVVSRGAAMWEGIVFDHGGTAGANRFFGRESVRFRAQRGESRLDAGPALVLVYEGAPWPTLNRRSLPSRRHEPIANESWKRAPMAAGLSR